MLTLQDFLEAAHRIGHRDLLALAPGEHLRHAEWLAQEALDLAGTQHRELVLRRKLVHSENRDDVLEILVALQDLLYSPRDVVMLLTDDFGREGTRGRSERIHGRVDPQLGNRAFQDDGRVQVGEGGGGCGVGQIVGWHVHRLKRRD